MLDTTFSDCKMISHVSELFTVLSTKWSMGSSLDELLNAEFKEAFDEFDKVTNLCLILSKDI